MIKNKIRITNLLLSFLFTGNILSMSVEKKPHLSDTEDNTFHKEIKQQLITPETIITDILTEIITQNKVINDQIQINYNKWIIIMENIHLTCNDIPFQVAINTDERSSLFKHLKFIFYYDEHKTITSTLISPDILSEIEFRILTTAYPSITNEIKFQHLLLTFPDITRNSKYKPNLIQKYKDKIIALKFSNTIQEAAPEQLIINLLAETLATAKFTIDSSINSPYANWKKIEEIILTENYMEYYYEKPCYINTYIDLNPESETFNYLKFVFCYQNNILKEITTSSQLNEKQVEQIILSCRSIRTIQMPWLSA